MSGAHPDLTWVAPSGAHEMLVSDIDGPVVSAASKTPFEASCRVFVIERVDELGDEAANRMLKTLEEPASFVHLILLTDRLVEVLPTIRSRCQLVRFDAPPVGGVAGRRRPPASTARPRWPARACRWRRRAGAGAGQRGGPRAPRRRRAVRAGGARRGDGARRARGPTCWPRSGPGARRRVPSSRRGRPPRSSCTRARSASGSRPSGPSGSGGRAAGSRPARSISRCRWCRCGTRTWRAWPGAADELVRNSDRLDELEADSGVDPHALRGAIELVEDTRAALSAQRLRGAGVRSARLPPGTAAGAVERDRRVACTSVPAGRASGPRRSSSR